MKKMLAFFIVFMAFVEVSFALNADEIMEKANRAHYYAANDGRALIEMEITDSSGRKRNREMVILRKDVEDGGAQKYFVYFLKPADVEKMVFMVWKQAKGDDDRWLYVPAIDLVKRIASSDKRSSFAGGEFTYEDVSGRRTSDDAHELVGEEEYKGRKVYVVKNTPKDVDVVEFAHYVIKIDKETFLPVRGEYFDKKGKLYRVMESEESSVIDNVPTVTKTKAENFETGLKTTIVIKDVKYNSGLKEAIFTERYLRKPPQEVR